MARPRYHLLLSAGLGTFMWARTRTPGAALAPLLSGFLIDVDHFADYALVRTRLGHGVIFLPLHGWEYVPLWILGDRMLGTRGGLTLGYVAHLLVDQIWNEKRSHLAYLISWRARRGFRADELGPLDPTRRHKWRRESPLGLLRWF